MPDRRPNILFVLTDQQRFDTVGALNNPVIRTPVLDRIFREGVAFTSAYTPSPVSVSARCALITGQYPARNGCYDNGFPMPERPTFMQCLTEGGYQTHGVGKMHFTPDSSALRGFQSRRRQEEVAAGSEADDYARYVHDQGLSHIHDLHGQRSEMYYIPQLAQMAPEHHPTAWVARESLAFLKKRERSKPFMLWTSFVHPHPPFAAPTPWNRLYRTPKMPHAKQAPDNAAVMTWYNHFQNRYKYRDHGIDDNLVRTIRAYYYACISFIDYNLGLIVQQLEQDGELDNTLILFSSDHGEFLGDYDCFGKRSFLDSAARIPLLARLPGVFEGGRQFSTPASLVDIFPTMLHAAKVERAGLQLDGAALQQFAQTPDADRRVYGQLNTKNRALYYMVERGVKYAYSAPDRKEFLFDRRQDPLELANRAYNPWELERAKQCRKALVTYLAGTPIAADALDGENFRDHLPPLRNWERDRDAELLIQDPAIGRNFKLPGYTDEGNG